MDVCEHEPLSTEDFESWGAVLREKYGILWPVEPDSFNPLTTQEQFELEERLLAN